MKKPVKEEKKEEPKVRISVAMPEYMIKRLEVIAKKRGVTVDEIVEEAILMEAKRRGLI